MPFQTAPWLPDRAFHFGKARADLAARLVKWQASYAVAVPQFSVQSRYFPRHTGARARGVQPAFRNKTSLHMQVEVTGSMFHKSGEKIFIGILALAIRGEQFSNGVGHLDDRFRTPCCFVPKVSHARLYLCPRRILVRN